MTTFGGRLRAERKRLGMNQGDFAAHGGMKKDAQLNYENGTRRPDAAYFEAIAELGVDVLYVITGRRESSILSSEESELVRLYQEAPDAVKAAAIAALTAGATPSKYQLNFGGATIGNQTVGDVKMKSSKIVGVEKKK